MKLGINLESLSDWARTPYECNAFPAARLPGPVTTSGQAWGSDGFPVTAPCDANGWPTQDAGYYLMTEVVGGQRGDYELTWDGGGTANALLGATFIPPKTLRVVGPNVFVAFTGTNGGPKNIRLIRPGWNVGRFTPALLSVLSVFDGPLRFMDLQQINNSPIATWSNRPLPSDAQFSGPRGVPLEWCIDLANAAGRDMWICMPPRSRGDYWAGAAKLIAGRLNKGLVCHVEFGNEFWNVGTFQHARDLQALAVLDPETAGIPNSGDPYQLDNSAFGRLLRAYAKFSCMMVNVMREAAPGGPFRFPLAGQMNDYLAAFTLSAVRRYGYKPSDLFDSLSFAPYYNPAGPITFSFVQSSVTAYRKLADANGIGLTCYECGPANIDSDQLTVASFLKLLSDLGIDTANYYTLASANLRGQNWGALTRIDEPYTPKFLGIKNFQAAKGRAAYRPPNRPSR